MSWVGWMVVGLAASALLYAGFLVVLVSRGRGRDVAAVARFIPDLLVLVRRLLADPGVARRDKLLLGLAGAYLALPFDLVPDFIPIAGQADDAVVVALVLRRFLRASGPERVRELWPGPPSALAVLLRLSA